MPVRPSVLIAFRFAAALLCTIPLLCGAPPTSKLPDVLKQLESTVNFSGVGISPDGKWISWVSKDASNPDSTSIYLAARSATAKPVAITVPGAAKKQTSSGVAWAADSARFAFFSEDEHGQKQLYLYSVPSKQARRLTELKGYMTDVRWSPDRKRLAFLFAAGGGGAGPLAAVPAQTGAIGTDLHNQRLTLLSAEGGAPQQLSPENLNIYEFDWSPDGKGFAATAAPGPADNNWWTAQLYSVDAASGSVKLLYHPPPDRQIALPRWSADGLSIAFIGGLMSDEGATGGDLFLLPAAGGEPENLTPGRKASPSSLAWMGDRLFFTEAISGSSEMATLRPGHNNIEVLWKGTEHLHLDGDHANLAIASDGRTSAVIRSTWERAPEVWTGPVGDWQQVTHDNAGQKPHWGQAKSITWQKDGTTLQGWLLYPDAFDAQKRYPMITEIHGGPASMRGAAWPSARYDLSVMASLGYFVFFPNARGSYGTGETFTQANVKDFGHGDLQDVLAGVDRVLKEAPIDPDRLGVTGWSYGGFMTMWTVTQTDRFRAAVAGAGIANWQSYYGQNTIDQWMIPYFGASVYDDPAVYAKSSPINFIKQVKTPTLVVVGERDGECPAPQSFEFWHALQALKVPTQLVVYAGEGHSFHDEKDRLDVLRRAAEWFDHYLGGNQAKAAAKLQ